MGVRWEVGHAEVEISYQRELYAGFKEISKDKEWKGDPDSLQENSQPVLTFILLTPRAPPVKP